MTFDRALRWVEIFTRIRLERPDLWKQIQKFAEECKRERKVA
jgi:hypothetical protein